MKTTICIQKYQLHATVILAALLLSTIKVTTTLVQTPQSNESIFTYTVGFRLHVKQLATIFGGMRFHMDRTVSIPRRARDGKTQEITGF